jgi:hypothetical protein
MNRLEINEKDMIRQMGELHKRFHILSGNDVKRAQSSALNKAGARVKTHAIKQSAGPLGVSQKLIRPRIKLRKSTTRKQVATVWGGMQGIPLIKLKAKEFDGGVQAGRYLVAGAFIATATNSPKQRRKGRSAPSSGLVGNAQVFKRKGRGAYPLEAQKLNIAPTVSRQMKQSAERVLRNDMRKIMQQEYRFRVLRKAGIA